MVGEYLYTSIPLLISRFRLDASINNKDFESVTLEIVPEKTRNTIRNVL